MAPLRTNIFPKILSQFSLSESFRGIDSLLFKEQLCHRCQMAVPSVTYCHKMYGGEFVQNFGWYINQTYLRFGISRTDLEFLSDLCPEDLRRAIVEYKSILESYQTEQERLNRLLRGPKRTDISPNERMYWANVKYEEAEEYERLLKLKAKTHRAITTYLENSVRDDFGMRHVGEAWVSENILAQIVRKIYPETTIVMHHRPTWLNGLEIDIYLEELQIGFEYQGQQHFFPIEAWGGKEALEKLKERDLVKIALCKKQGVRLVHINFFDPLTEEFVHEQCRRL